MGKQWREELEEPVVDVVLVSWGRKWAATIGQADLEIVDDANKLEVVDVVEEEVRKDRFPNNVVTAHQAVTGVELVLVVVLARP
eukprot:1028508-Amphidinium_carterae.2